MKEEIGKEKRRRNKNRGRLEKRKEYVSEKKDEKGKNLIVVSSDC
jgi:hypothetical protein